MRFALVIAALLSLTTPARAGEPAPAAPWVSATWIGATDLLIAWESDRPDACVWLGNSGPLACGASGAIVYHMSHVYIVRVTLRVPQSGPPPFQVQASQLIPQERPAVWYMAYVPLTIGASP